jgi:arylsulfatase
VPEPWLSKYKGKYDDGYNVLHKKRFNAAKKSGLIPESAELPAPHPSVKPWNLLSDEEKAIQARTMEVYAGMVENLDYHIGRVINYLKDTGQYDNTVIIFMSDNGANPWDSEDYPGKNQQEFIKQFDNSLENIGHPNSAIAYGIGWATAGEGPKDLFKFTVGEGGISSPLIISGPGIVGNGRTIESFTYVTDIMPTILEMTDSKHPKVYNGNKIHPLDGKSLLPVLTAKSDKIYSDEDIIAGEMLGGKWVRQGNYKAVMIAPPYGSNKWELYDISVDPGETNNLASTKPEKLKTLADEYEKYAARVSVVPPN